MDFGWIVLNNKPSFNSESENNLYALKKFHHCSPHLRTSHVLTTKSFRKEFIGTGSE